MPMRIAGDFIGVRAGSQVRVEKLDKLVGSPHELAPKSKSGPVRSNQRCPARLADLNFSARLLLVIDSINYDGRICADKCPHKRELCHSKSQAVHKCSYERVRSRAPIWWTTIAYGGECRSGM